MTMRTRDRIVCDCGHQGSLCCAENDQPYSSLWESYSLEGFACSPSDECGQGPPQCPTLRPKAEHMTLDEFETFGPGNFVQEKEKRSRKIQFVNAGPSALTRDAHNAALIGSAVANALRP